MSQIDQIIDGVLRRESAEYTNHPSDRGGPTKYGITQATLAKERGVLVTPRDVELLTEAEARAIYFRSYVTAPGFEAVVAVSLPIAEELVDAGVLSGPGRVAMWLQVALNALNRQGVDYPDIREDGKVGQETIDALTMYLRKRAKDGVTVLLRALNAQQGAFFLSTARSRPADEDFVFGWLLNRVGAL